MAEDVNMTLVQVGGYFSCATYWVPRCKEEWVDGRRCDLREGHPWGFHDHFGETPERRVQWMRKGD